MFLARLKDPSYCAAQADIARAQAAFMRDRRTKALLLRIADGYQHIAEKDGYGEQRRHRPAKPAPPAA
jgi:hypothetical protein